MTIDEVKRNLGGLVGQRGSVYEIAGFCEEPVVILRLVQANPFDDPPESKLVMLPQHVRLFPPAVPLPGRANQEENLG